MFSGHSATLWQEGVYIWGGKADKRQGRHQPEYNSDVFLLRPNACLAGKTARVERLQVSFSVQPGDSGATVGRLSGRAHHSAALYGHFLFITGGMCTESAMDADFNAALPIFNLERRSWSIKKTFGDIPSARCHHITAIYNTTLMLHGGYPILGNQQKDLTPEEFATMQHALYDVHELDTSTLRWRRIHTTQSPSLWGHSAVFYSPCVIAFGGVNVVENVESTTIAVWNPKQERWRFAGPRTLEVRCTTHTAVLIGDSMLIFGGVSMETSARLQSLYEFKLDFGDLKELHPQGQVPAGRLGHAAVAFHQTMFIIGGTVRQGAEGAEECDRFVHMYHVAKNAWTSCPITMGEEAAVAEEETQKVAAPSLQSWIPAEQSAPLVEPQSEEWRGVTGSIRDTIARAQAIQSLTTGAANALEKSLAQQQQQQQPSSSQSVSPQRREVAGYVGEGVPASADPDTWRMVDHLRLENDRLRRQLEEYRAGTGSLRNPYEVPIYNTGQSGTTLPPNDLPVDDARSPAQMLRLTHVPRLNINVAEPPRTIGGEKTGRMSRDAVTALVNSSLHRDQPATVSLASRLRHADVSLDPMSYLHVTPSVARASAQAASTGSGALTYDQLLAKTAGGGYAPASSNVPATLQPLLSVFASSLGAPAPEYEAYQQPSAPRPPAGSPQAAEAAKLKSASLASIVHGKDSMLSLNLLRGR